MGISCGCDESDDCEWYYEVDFQPSILDTRRSRKCVSCKTKIAVGEAVFMVARYRPPRHKIEENIHGDEVPLANWHLCPRCGAIFHALHALNVGVDLGNDDMHDCLKEFNALYAPEGFSLKVPGYPVEETKHEQCVLE